MLAYMYNVFSLSSGLGFNVYGFVIDNYVTFQQRHYD